MERPLKKDERQQLLAEHIRHSPFSTDEELAQLFGVSVQTIRLDRLELGIPEVRERMKQLAEGQWSKLKALADTDLVGELIELELGKKGLSLLTIESNMVFSRTGIARGHLLFAQANSLAVALVDAPLALTGTVRVSFLRPVRLGERVIARAEVVKIKQNRYYIQVTSSVKGQDVLKGLFVVFALEEDANENRS
ncbi:MULTISPECIES: transcription factor FapR [unclassified Carboxydocella]|uniref:transcription factor FapR n=1 Tax=unclassified Carboxydocella TaxID=2685367 RepID=UPI0009ADCA84|nr:MULTISPECIES: transcription factor FapR [unclassified Carboxydocella]GAW28412.1 regulatory protein DeoR [Carboxydocella sp. ULO1]GAW30835.1 regulatory protein DeoR [Carboxydocella sp. JDF658]